MIQFRNTPILHLNEERSICIAIPSLPIPSPLKTFSLSIWKTFSAQDDNNVKYITILKFAEHVRKRYIHRGRRFSNMKKEDSVKDDFLLEVRMGNVGEERKRKREREDA